MLFEALASFLSSSHGAAGAVENERGLQMEAGLMFREMGCHVRFEVSCRVEPLNLAHTKPQKRDIDLLVQADGESLAVELKVPMAGRVPETMFDFYTDVAFVEAVVRAGIADRGACLLLTSDPGFWSGTQATGIYKPLRVPGAMLNGLVGKPTGKRDTAVFVAGQYRPVWRDLGNRALLSSGRYVLLEVRGDGETRA
ncbi:MAG: hypothetical protein AAGK00_19785 [Pseudomonadota bacterium]